MHDQLAAHQNFAILGDSDLDPVERRADRIHGDAGARPVAADDRPGLGLAIALQQGEAHRLEEQADVRVQRRAARHQRLHPAAKARANLGDEGAGEQRLHRRVENGAFAGLFLGGDAQRLIEQIGGEFPLLLDRLDDPRAQHFEQARDDDHDGRPRFLDIAGQLLQPFGIINLSAQQHRQKLAAAMFIGVAERQEGQKHFVAPAEILGHDRTCAFAIEQDRAMMLHHPARRAACTAGVDDAGLILARRGLRCGDNVDIGGGVARMCRDQIGPQMAGAAALCTAQRLHADDEIRLRSNDGGHQRLRQLGCRHDDRARAAVGQDMLMIARGVGGVGRHGDAAGRHDRQVGDAEFRPVLADQHDRIARFQPLRLERRGQCRDLARDLGPAQRSPFAIALAPQKGFVALFLGAGEEHGDKVGKFLDRPQGSTPAVFGASGARLSIFQGYSRALP